jgi:hypothetical protein
MDARAALGSLAMVIAAACAEPVAPGASPATAPLDQDLWSADFPEASGPGRIFNFSSRDRYPVSPRTIQSRFVLYDDSTFSLQFRGEPDGYHGRYTEDGRDLSLVSMPPSPRFSAWRATGTLDGLVLTVRYWPEDHWLHLEDAVYTLAR